MTTKRRKPQPDKAPVTGNAFISDLPFTKRWLKALESALEQGGWWVLSAEAQQGKSSANRAFAEAHPTYKRDGATVVPVATTTACKGENLLYTDLAESLGVSMLMRRQNPTKVLASAIMRSHTRMIIVNNGHYMDERQWERLFALHEVYFRRGGVAPAVVFSSVGQNVGFQTLDDEARQQHARRLFYDPIPGHERKEVRGALEKFLQRAPEVLKTNVLEYSGRLFELLTDPFFDPRRTKRVVTIDIEEVASRIEALHASGVRSGAELVEMAVADYRIARTAAEREKNEDKDAK